MTNETREQVGRERPKRSLLEKIFLTGLAISFGGVAMLTPFLAVDYYHHKNNRNLEARGFVAPNNLRVYTESTFGVKKTKATYNDTNDLFKIGTNGIPYFEPIELNEGGRK